MYHELFRPRDSRGNTTHVLLLHVQEEYCETQKQLAEKEAECLNLQQSLSEQTRKYEVSSHSLTYMYRDSFTVTLQITATGSSL